MKGWQSPRWWIAVLLLIAAAPCFFLSNDNFPLRALSMVLVMISVVLVMTLRKR